MKETKYEFTEQELNDFHNYLQNLKPGEKILLPDEKDLIFKLINANELRPLGILLQSGQHYLKLKNKDGKTPAHRAAMSIDTNIIEFLIDEYPAVLALKNSRDETPVEYIAMSLTAHVIKLLTTHNILTASEKSPDAQMSSTEMPQDTLSNYKHARLELLKKCIDHNPDYLSSITPHIKKMPSDISKELSEFICNRIKTKLEANNISTELSQPLAEAIQKNLSSSQDNKTELAKMLAALLHYLEDPKSEDQNEKLNQLVKTAGSFSTKTAAGGLFILGGLALCLTCIAAAATPASLLAGISFLATAQSSILANIAAPTLVGIGLTLYGAYLFGTNSHMSKLREPLIDIKKAVQEPEQDKKVQLPAPT